MVDLSVQADLAASGLTLQDIRGRVASEVELTACNCPESVSGYVIPYFSIEGKPLPFYRIKLFNVEPKYRQPKKSPNHIYYPKDFKKVFLKQVESLPKGSSPYILLTEGEKKAAATTSRGFPCVAVGGVDNWKTKTLEMPDDVVLTKTNRQTIAARFNSNNTVEDYELAKGFTDLCTFLQAYNANVIIVFDTDVDGIKPQVQRSAANLAYEFRFRGLSTEKIRQMVLPRLDKLDKIGIDDYIVSKGSDALQELITEVLSQRVAFPKNPSPKEFINKKLDKGKLTRKEYQEIAYTVISELDNRGRRLRAESTQMPYYFDEDDYKLMPVILHGRNQEPLHESIFGKYLYQKFNVAIADQKLIQWIASQFTGEEPVDTVEPKRVITRVPGNEDNIAIQLSDSHFIIVTPNDKEPFKIYTNGSQGILFEQDQVEAVNLDLLNSELQKQIAAPIKPWWKDVFEEVSLQENTSPELAVLLFYISPWLYRWRGTQLPVEVLCGEAGSGKSSLLSLRLSIMNGRPVLRNMPSDLRDWYAGVASTGGLHVVDNVHFTNKDIRQRISDEVCRITTEPEPHIEMRKLYTTINQLRVPVNTIFAFTAIKQPFYNADFIQRAAILELHALGKQHDGDWVPMQLNRFGGREAWLAHHIVVLHKFLSRAVKKGMWDKPVKTVHRLAHYEQCLSIMADVLGIDRKPIAQTLKTQLETSLSEADEALEGLIAFAEHIWRERHGSVFTCQDIANWIQFEEEYSDNSQINNSRRLGKYMTSHMSMITQLTSIRRKGRYGNRVTYYVATKPPTLVKADAEKT